MNIHHYQLYHIFISQQLELTRYTLYVFLSSHNLIENPSKIVALLSKSTSLRLDQANHQVIQNNEITKLTKHTFNSKLYEPWTLHKFLLSFSILGSFCVFNICPLGMSCHASALEEYLVKANAGISILEGMPSGPWNFTCEGTLILRNQWPYKLEQKEHSEIYINKYYC